MLLNLVDSVRVTCIQLLKIASGYKSPSHFFEKLPAFNIISTRIIVLNLIPGPFDSMIKIESPIIS